MSRTYCIGIARMLLREMSRDRSRQARPLDEAPEPRTPPVEPESDAEGAWSACGGASASFRPKPATSFCITTRATKATRSGIARASRELLGIPASTLRMRALRVRERLQLCAESCVQRPGGGVM